MSTTYFLPPLPAKARPIVVEPVRASASGYAVAMSRLPVESASAPKRSGPVPKYANPTRLNPKAD